MSTISSTTMCLRAGTPVSAQASTPRTVAHVLDFAPREMRSMEQFLLLLAEKLLGRGWLTVHVFSAEPSGCFADRLHELGSPCLVTQFQPNVRQAVTLGRRLRSYAPDVLTTSFMSKFNPAIPVLKWAAGARQLAVCDQTSGEARPTRGVARLLSRLRGRYAATYIDRLVCVSDFVRRRDVEKVHLPADRALVIYNGVDLRKYAPALAEQDRQGLTIAFIGQLIPEKGVLTLLRAIQRLRDSVPAFQVLLAGRGSQEGELREFCKTAGLTDQVRFLGQIDWVPRLLSNADVVVIPSEWQEAFGVVLIESLACGACVLASDAGGIPEVIGEDGVAGVIFRKGDADDLAEKLSALLADQARRAQMRSAARQRAVQCFSIERMVEGHAAVIEETVAQASAAGRS